MMTNEFQNPKKTDVLYEHNDNFEYLNKLYELKKFPKVTMFTGEKGIGKFTFINHFLTYIFDKDNYNLKQKKINMETSFYKQYLNNIFPNIIHLNGDDFVNIKIDDIRLLKSKILKTSLSLKNRFIVLDNVETFNINSLNALLKLIEEPISNHFILINNKTRPLIKTIHSRTIEIKITLREEERLKIIESLIEKNSLESQIDYKSVYISPGNYLIFTDICGKNSIDINNSFLENLNIITKLYKKNKDKNLINLILFLNDIYFSNFLIKKTENLDKIFDQRFYVINNIKKFINQNLNQNSFINAINNKLLNE